MLLLTIAASVCGTTLLKFAQTPSATGWWRACTLAGYVCEGAALALYPLAMRSLNVSFVTLVWACSSITCGTLTGVFLFGERFTWQSAASVGCALLAAVLQFT